MLESMLSRHTTKNNANLSVTTTINTHGPSTVGTEVLELATLDRVTRRGNRAYAVVTV